MIEAESHPESKLCCCLFFLEKIGLRMGEDSCPDRTEQPIAKSTAVKSESCRLLALETAAALTGREGCVRNAKDNETRKTPGEVSCAG